MNLNNVRCSGCHNVLVSLLLEKRVQFQQQQSMIMECSLEQRIFIVLEQYGLKESTQQQEGPPE